MEAISDEAADDLLQLQLFEPFRTHATAILDGLRSHFLSSPPTSLDPFRLFRISDVAPLSSLSADQRTHRAAAAVRQLGWPPALIIVEFALQPIGGRFFNSEHPPRALVAPRHAVYALDVSDPPPPQAPPSASSSSPSSPPLGSLGSGLRSPIPLRPGSGRITPAQVQQPLLPGPPRIQVTLFSSFSDRYPATPVYSSPLAGTSAYLQAHHSEYAARGSSSSAPALSHDDGDDDELGSLSGDDTSGGGGGADDADDDGAYGLGFDDIHG